MRSKDTFKMNLKNTLSSDDFKVLTLLYQPLLGNPAYTLFQTLYHLGNNIEYKHQDIYDLLNIKSTDYLKAREKLEALGLLDVYKNEGDYLYLIKNPLSPKQFLNDTILGSYLESEIGKKGIDSLISLFKVELSSTENYTNITKNFNDVYEIKELETIKPIDNLRGRSYNCPSIENNFSYDEFINKLPERLKKAQLLNPKTREDLNRISFMYELSVDDLVSIFIESCDENGYSSLARFKMRARIYYEKTHTNSFPVISVVDKDNQSEFIDNLSPQVILQQYAKNKISSAVLDDMITIIERTGVAVGVLNVVLINILKHKDGILPARGYIEKVILSWQEKGVTNTKLALAYATELEKSVTQNTKAKKKAIEPEWLEDVLKDLEKGGW